MIIWTTDISTPFHQNIDFYDITSEQYDVIKAVAGGGGGGHRGRFTPLLKKPYFLCRIIRLYTNNPKCQYVYLSFYLNDYQIIDKVNTI